MRIRTISLLPSLLLLLILVVSVVAPSVLVFQVVAVAVIKIVASHSVFILSLHS